MRRRPYINYPPNGKEFPVKPGDAILTRPGSSHGLKQTGKDDLMPIIVYER